MECDVVVVGGGPAGSVTARFASESGANVLMVDRRPEIGIPVPAPPTGSSPAFVRYPIWVQDRRKAMRIASSHVVLGQWFNTVLEESITPEHGDYERGSCPRAEQAAEHLVNLPTHPRVKHHDVDSIVSAVARANIPAGRTA